MHARALLMGLLVAGSALADADPASQALDRFAQTRARDMAGAREAVARAADGGAKWAGVWMDKERACPHGRLTDDTRRLVADGGRLAGDQGARLILYTPGADAPMVGQDARAAAARVEVRANDQIGAHCYLVIRR